jgi:hypothetical protein
MLSYVTLNPPRFISEIQTHARERHSPRPCSVFVLAHEYSQLRSFCPRNQTLIPFRTPKREQPCYASVVQARPMLGTTHEFVTRQAGLSNSRLR